MKKIHDDQGDRVTGTEGAVLVALSDKRDERGSL